MAINKKSKEYIYQNTKTNILKPCFSYEAIKKDFYIYCFKDNDAKKIYKSTLLDTIKKDLDAQSIVYLQGKVFYVLFDKEIHSDEINLKNKFRKIRAENETISIEKVDNLHEFVEKLDGNRYLIQLFLNYLAITNIKGNYLNNTTGALYYVIDKKGKQFITLKIQVDKNLNLLLDVKTFTSVTERKYMKFEGKTKFEDLPQFKIIPSTRKMTRVPFSNKEDKNTFVIRQPFKTKNTVEFINFSNYNSFEKSKCGVLYKLLDELDKRFNRYLKLEFKILEDANSLEYLNDFSNTETRVKEFYFSKPIRIVDAIASYESQQLVDNLSEFFTEKYKIKNISVGELDKKSLNLIVIHNEETYKKKGLEDAKKLTKNTYDDFNIQHITLEGFHNKKPKENYKIPTNKKGDKSPVLDNIFKELYIKQDIINSKISIIDWNYGNWKFVVREKSHADDKKADNFIFYEVTVSDEGQLSFTQYDIQQKKYIDYATIFKHYDDANELIECLIVSNNDDINVVIDTGSFTIPEIKEIGDALKNAANDTIYTKPQIVTMFEEFLLQSPKYYQDEDSKKILERFKNYADKLIKDEINNIFKEYFKAKMISESPDEKPKVLRVNNIPLKKDFNKFFLEKTGDILFNPSRSNNEKEKIQSNFGIYYHDDEVKNEVTYFAGDCTEINPLQSKFSNSTHIRKVKSYSGKLFFKHLLPMLNVDFVKHKEYTVLPFPIKYLKEWCRKQ